MSQEIDALLQSYIDGTLSADAAERLLRLVEADDDIKPPGA